MTSTWSRHGGWLALAGVLLVACGIGAAVTLLGPEEGAAETRDEAAFLRNVKDFFGGEAHPLPEGVPDSIYIAEGDHACQWLRQQPVVVGDAPGQLRYHLFQQFLDEEEPVDQWPFGSGPGVRGSVVYDAWDFLCPEVAATRTWNLPPGSD